MDKTTNNKRMRRRSSLSSAPSRQYDGVPLPGRPADEVPEIPRNLPDLNSDMLSHLFARYVAWQNFIAVRFTEAEIDEANAETQLKVSQAQALVANWTGDKDDRVTIVKAERELDPQVRELQDRYDTARAHRKMLGTLAGNMERAANLISREVTRRGDTDNMNRRAMRWTP